MEKIENDHPGGDVDLMFPQKPHFLNNHLQMLQWTQCHRSENLQELLKQVPNDFVLKLHHLQLPLRFQQTKNVNKLKTLQCLKMIH